MMTYSRNCAAIVGSIGLVCIFLIAIKYDYNQSNIIFAVDTNYARTKFDNHRQCLIERLENYTEIWTEFIESVAKCYEKCLKNNLNYHSIRNKDETKYAIIPDKLDMTTPCNIVSLGIGNDITAEKQMYDAMPWCRFYGVDPVDYRTLYESFGGVYYRMAIDSTRGIFNQTKAPQMPMMAFFKYVLNIEIIDHLIMDLEGPEWRLLPLFERNAILAQNNIIICQLNVELHGPPEYGGSKRLLATIVTNLLKNSNFIPIIASDEYAPMIRIFWININDAYCVKKFLS